MSYQVTTARPTALSSERSDQSDSWSLQKSIDGALKRIVAIALAVLVCSCVAFGLHAVSRPSQAVAQESSQTVSYTVKPGDTLWSYAEKITPEHGDVSENVEKLISINNLDSTRLVPGQKILVPVR